MKTHLALAVTGSLLLASADSRSVAGGRATCSHSTPEQRPLFAELHRMMPACGGRTEDMALADVDGDGDLDLATAGGFGEVYPNRLLLNDGYGVFEDVTERLPEQAGFGFAVAFGDVDGDGDADLLVGRGGLSAQSDRQNRLYLNTGSGHFTDATARLPADRDYTKSLELADVDGDGDLDLHAVNTSVFGFPARDRLYLNDGTGDFVDGSHRLPVDDDTDVAALGDLDGDGDVDALLGNRVSDRAQMYLNDGHGVFADVSSSVPSAPAPRAVTLGDVDGDDDLDALLGYHDGQTRLWLNAGDGTFSDETPGRVPPDSDYTLRVALVDVDGDADLDAFLTNDGQNRLYANSGDGFFADAPESLPLGEDYNLGLAIGDVDADADADICLGTAFSADRLLLGDGRGSFADTAANLPPRREVSSDVALGDVNGDGHVDALVANRLSGDRLYLNDGTGKFADAPGWIPPGLHDSSAVALLDVDGDGDLDALLGGLSGEPPFPRNRLYLNDGQRFLDASDTLPSADGHWTRSLASGDLDGDGDQDVVLGTLGRNHVYLNDGSGHFVDIEFPVFAFTVTAEVADLDGDGDLDLMFGGPQGNELWSNDGSGGFSDASGNLPPGGEVAALADLDGDLDVDALVAGSGVWLNDGTGVFEAGGGWDGGLGFTTAVLGDLDGDGDTDAFTGFLTYAVHLNDGSGHFHRAPSDLLPDCIALLRGAALADLDHDRDLDLFIVNEGHDQVLQNLSLQVAWRGTPRIGKPFSLDLYGPPFAPWRLRGLSETRGPSPVPSNGLFAKGYLDAQGRASLVYQVPNLASLVGRSVSWRAVIGCPPEHANPERTTFTDL